jgi:putative ubiquitin-RnfH superfamily antitoxin RatB of RatAB toxin-antitoxin module
MHVEVVYALPDSHHQVSLELGPGACVADALNAVADRAPFAGLDLANLPVGIFGDRVTRDRLLCDGDRFELYRPLLIDPREARRQRARQGEGRSAGRTGRSRSSKP